MLLAKSILTIFEILKIIPLSNIKTLHSFISNKPFISVAVPIMLHKSHRCIGLGQAIWKMILSYLD